MIENRDNFFCEEHKLRMPDGFTAARNLQARVCEQCGKPAEVVIFPKPLNYPKLGYA